MLLLCVTRFETPFLSISLCFTFWLFLPFSVFCAVFCHFFKFFDAQFVFPWDRTKIPIVVLGSMGPLQPPSGLTPVAGPIFETKNQAIFLERFFGRGITAREQLSRAVILARF